MGGKFSLETHGVFNQKLYDGYLNRDNADDADDADERRLCDLSGKTVAITGTSPGSIGYFVAKAAVLQRAKTVLLLNRPSERSARAERELREVAAAAASKEPGATPPATTEVRTVECDLLDAASVKRAADEVNAVVAETNDNSGGLHVLCNNAGIMAAKDTRSKDGYDVQMQANMLSHFLLTHLCMPSLERAAAASDGGEARVVFHSSSARDMTGKNLEKKYFEKCETGTLGGDSHNFVLAMAGSDGPWQRYHQTKLANSAFAMALHDHLREKKSRVKSLACDPGWALSNLQLRATENGDMPDGAAKMGKYLGQSAADGSLPCVMACFSPNAKSGDFYHPQKLMTGEPVKSISEGVPLNKNGEKLTCDPYNKRLVWDLCQQFLEKEGESVK